MMRLHLRSAAVVLGGALAVAAATPLAAVAQKNGHSGSSGKSSQGNHSSGSGKSAHATTSTGHHKTGTDTKGHSDHSSAAHHAKHRYEHLRHEIHRLEQELRKEHLKHEHAARTRELERLRHEIHRLERELHPDHLKHIHPLQQPASTSIGTTAAAPQPQAQTQHAKFGRVEVTLPHANAEVLFNGSKTTASGTYRVFRTGDLTPGKRYTYRVVALWNHNGNQIREERTVHLIAGETAEVHFHLPDHSSGENKNP
jgi:uncharacterized protein (TIGR03000 family)